MNGDRFPSKARWSHTRSQPFSRPWVKIARKGAEARWGDDDLPQALDEGILKIGDAEIACAVLDTKQRVLTQSGVMRSLGRAWQVKGRQYYDGDVNLPAFLTAKNLKPFIPKELYVTSSQIEFRQKNRGKAVGYPAEGLPKVCRVFVDADTANKLTAGQKHIAAKARLLLDGLAEVGIIGYANGVPASLPQVVAEVKGDPTVYPPAEVRRRLYTIMPADRAYERQRSRAWTRITTGR